MSQLMDLRAAQRLAFVRAHVGMGASPPVSASSDAGFRSYWRTHDSDGRSLIVMDSPPEREDVRPWLLLRDVFKSGGVRVPEVLAQDLEAGFLLLEDLGGPTLLQRVDHDNADTWFTRAREQLLRIQRINPPAALTRYDEALIRRELTLFPEWFLGRHLGVTLDTDEQQALAGVFDRLVTAFMRQPQVLVHRDFMPRNLMPLADGVAVLDFQDAVHGPLAYDVLSLFKDAFLSWPQVRIDRWISDYRTSAIDAGLPVPSVDGFQRDLDLTGMQRHLKVLGIFARLQHRDSKPRYLADAPRFIAYLKDTLSRHPEFAALDALLDRHVVSRIAPLELPQ